MTSNFHMSYIFQKKKGLQLDENIMRPNNKMGFRWD